MSVTGNTVAVLNVAVLTVGRYVTPCSLVTLIVSFSLGAVANLTT